MWYPQKKEVVQVIHPASDIVMLQICHLANEYAQYKSIKVYVKDMALLNYPSLHWPFFQYAAGSNHIYSLYHLKELNA
jgi:hypothetical protein